MEILDEKTFEELIESRNLKALRERLIVMDTLDIAILLDSVSEEEMALAFRLLPKDIAVEVFDDFDGPTQHRLLESLANRTVSQLLEAMSPDDRTELLEEVPASVARRLMGLLSPEQRQVTLQLLGYEENSAGREMTPYFVDLRSNMTVAQAMERIRTLAMDRETIYECYVIGPRRRLEGTVSLKELVLARPDMSVADVTHPNPRRVFTHSDREEAASVLRDNRLLAVPVVDREERLVGIITQDDVADIMEEEATEDIYRFGAVQGTERGYFTTRVFSVVRRRISWLLLLLVVNTVTASIIAGQEHLLAEVVLLAAFIPLLTGTGGNIGAQSATVVIRGLATGEIWPRRALSIVGPRAERRAAPWAVSWGCRACLVLLAGPRLTCLDGRSVNARVRGGTGHFSRQCASFLVPTVEDGPRTGVRPPGHDCHGYLRTQRVLFRRASAHRVVGAGAANDFSAAVPALDRFDDPAVGHVMSLTCNIICNSMLDNMC